MHVPFITGYWYFSMFVLQEKLSAIISTPWSKTGVLLVNWRYRTLLTDNLCKFAYLDELFFIFTSLTYLLIERLELQQIRIEKLKLHYTIAISSDCCHIRTEQHCSGVCEVVYFFWIWWIWNECQLVRSFEILFIVFISYNVLWICDKHGKF